MGRRAALRGQLIDKIAMRLLFVLTILLAGAIFHRLFHFILLIVILYGRWLWNHLQIQLENCSVILFAKKLPVL